MDWRKSTYSSNGGQACVETASDSAIAVIMVRDTTDRDRVTSGILRRSPKARSLTQHGRNDSGVPIPSLDKCPQYRTSH